MRRAAATEFSHNISLFVGDTVNPLSRSHFDDQMKGQGTSHRAVDRKEEMVLHNEGGNDELYAFRKNNE